MKWQPITTAPKVRGMRVLGWDGHEISVMSYIDRSKSNCDWKWEVQCDYGGHVTEYDITCKEFDGTITHWMPLPEPPTEAE